MFSRPARRAKSLASGSVVTRVHDIAARIRWLGILLMGVVFLAGCATTGSTKFVPGVRGCDHNGDEEQRRACDR